MDRLASFTEQICRTDLTMRSTDKNKMIRWIMLAIAIWGGTLALGAFLFGYDEQADTVVLSLNPARGLVVLSSVTLFLGGWGVMLWIRSQNKNFDDTSEIEAKNSPTRPPKP